jgi:hypothetical protein
MGNSIMTKQKQARGGKRPFSGRKPATYQTKTIAFRVRVQWVEDIKELVKKRISELKGN